MEFSPVKCLLLLLVVSAISWIVFIFAARLLAWLLSRTIGASVAFRVAGWNCLRDVVVRFKKGAIESVCVGEIKLSLRKSLVKLGYGFISKDPKLQLLITDLEVVIRPRVKKSGSTTQHKQRTAGRGKWMIVTSIARYLSITVTELVVKMPKAIFEVKDLMLDISKSGSSVPELSVKLRISPLLVHLGECKVSYDQSSDASAGERISTKPSLSSIVDTLTPFTCEELSINGEFGHEREVGIMIKNVEVLCGKVSVNLHEDLLVGKRSQQVEIGSSEINTDTVLEHEAASARTSKKQGQSLVLLRKYILKFPEKVSFSLPRLDVKFVHRDEALAVENNIMGIHLKSSKTKSLEELDESISHLDIQMDFSEIHLLRQGRESVLEILKVAVISSVDASMQMTVPLRAEVDIKLGGTQCNMLLGGLQPWLQLYSSNKRKKSALHKDTSSSRSQVSGTKAILWTCTISAPEMTIVLYSLKGLALYHVCSQSSHLFANNIATTGVPVHMELGEIHLHMSEEYQESLKESLFGVETNSTSVMHIARISVDLGPKERQPLEEHELTSRKKVSSIDVTGMEVDLNFQRVQSIVSTALSFKIFLKSLSLTGKATAVKPLGHVSKSSAKGSHVLRLNLERCSVSFHSEVGVESMLVPDPKRVNFGSQGGEVIISASTDGTPRMAKIMSTISGGSKKLGCTISLEIYHFSFSMNKEKQLTELELERAKMIYQTFSEENNGNVQVTLLDMQKSKFVQRSGGPNEIAVVPLFSATDIMVRWEPDVHFSFHEFILRLRLLLDRLKHESSDSLLPEEKASEKDAVDPSLSSKKHKKKERIVAVDIEMLRLSAELADGVDALLEVQSIFSENAQIGILLEDLKFSVNEVRLLKSSRMQISRVPCAPSASSSSDPKFPKTTTWDWVVQGLDVQICIPYRFHLRAVQDAVDDMRRGLKLVTTATTSWLHPQKTEKSKPKVKSTKFGCIKFNIRKVSAEIEEEPIQGWLDEHYQLMKKEVCERAVRLKFLDDKIAGCMHDPGNPEAGDLIPGKKFHHDGNEIDPHDSSYLQKLIDEIHIQAFRSYYEACQKLLSSEGSNACKEGFQAGFRPSTGRASLLSVNLTDLDLCLRKIEGGSAGMVDVVKGLDPVAKDSDIPFSRLYGRHVSLHTGSLAIQLRNYSLPLFSGTAGKCEGSVIFAQQATCFQPQTDQDVFIGRWRKVTLLRSASGTTPAMKMYSDLPICFQKAEVSFGVGFEPAFADVSFAVSTALRRANLSVRNSDSNTMVQPPKKERSLPWWDDMRYYIHGKIGLLCSEMRLNFLATTDPYEKLDKLQIVANYMDIQKSDGLVQLSAKDFTILVSSFESLNNYSKKPRVPTTLLCSPAFSLEVKIDWECDSDTPLNHYLHALPNEGKPREKVLDPFRSTSLSLRWNFCLKPPSLSNGELQDSSLEGSNYLSSSVSSLLSPENVCSDSPCMNVGARDLAWIFRWWSMLYSPPVKLRSFARWPRFKVPRAAKSGNLSLDKVMTEFMLRLDATPACIKHAPLWENDPADGLTFRMTKFKYEICFSRGRQKYTFESKRESLDLVYQGLDLHMMKVDLKKEITSSTNEDIKAKNLQQLAATERASSENFNGLVKKNDEDGFLLCADYFTIRRQASKADPARLLTWQEAGKRKPEATYIRSEFENGSESDHTRSDPSDDDGFNVVIADNCLRVFVYGLKLLWTIGNRDAVWSWVHEMAKAFEPPKPSPSRQYAQRKLAEQQKLDGAEVALDDSKSLAPPNTGGASGSSPRNSGESPLVRPDSSPSVKADNSSSGVAGKQGDIDDNEGEGRRHFMVNVIQPQFNLHSEEANGRFLLAAASGRVLARSFNSVLHVGYDVIEKALGTGSVHLPEFEPEMTWKRAEFSAMLEHVQAHVAPTDVDPGAGLQWLPKIPRNSPKVKRTGALLERVFMPCTMYFRYTRHKGGTADLKVKPLKELTFNSPNITATMTSRQFQVMVDVLSNLLFARLPKPRRNSLSHYDDEDEDVEEEADEVVPDGVEEVELARINLEQAERQRRLILGEIKTLSVYCDALDCTCLSPDKEGDLWMVSGGKSLLLRALKQDSGNKNKARKAASASLRLALQKAAQLRLMEKEKNKSPSYAMRISLRINKVAWSMLADGKSFAEAEINNMSYDFDRDYKDIGVAQFTTKYFVVRNCLPNAKSDTLLSAWSPPSEWGRNVMLRVDAKQGSPKDGNSILEQFQVEIYPLKIHLTEGMYRMMWEYLFPEEEHDSLRRQELWKVSTTVSSKRGKRSSFTADAASSSHSAKELESSSSSKHSAALAGSTALAHQTSSSSHGDPLQASKLQNLKASMVCGSTTELRRTSSFDKTWEENVAESVANELLLLQVHSSISASSGPLGVMPENQLTVDEAPKHKSKDSKTLKAGRPSHEEKKPAKTRNRKTMEFHNIKISQVELLVTYEGSRFAVNDLRLLMDTFHRVEFTGTWRRLFSRVKKHIIWGVLKSVTGMQGKKFKDKVQSQRQANNGGGSPDSDVNLSDSDGGGQAMKHDQFPATFFKRPNDGAGDGFVHSIRGLFNSQRRKAKAFVLRTMRGDAENEFHCDWSGSDTEFSPFARQLTITKAKRLIRRHTKKFRPRQRAVTQQRESQASSPKATSPYHSDSSGSSPYEDFHD